MAHRRPAALTEAADPGEDEMDEALHALAEPRRRAILRLVSQSELAAGEIAGFFDVTRSAVSQHLTVLKNAGLLTERKVATRRLYRFRPGGGGDHLEPGITQAGGQQLKDVRLVFDDEQPGIRSLPRIGQRVHGSIFSPTTLSVT